MTSICALCRATATLQRSHIIPEFLYKALYDDNHHFHVISAEHGASDFKKQKGNWEWLLCLACEQKLSRWEDYARRLLEGGVRFSVQKRGDALYITGLNAKVFRLFQLSVLWRASVAKDPFFANVSLGEHEEQIRTLLLNEEPGPWNLYGCFMFGLKTQHAPAKQLITQPTRTKIRGHWAYHFIFGGLGWLFIVSNHPFPAPLSSALLSPEGSVVITLVELFDTPWVKKSAL
jgi:hypothetical protein